MNLSEIGIKMNDMYLPKVSPDVLRSCLASLGEDKDAYNICTYERIKKENPVLWSLIAVAFEMNEQGNPLYNNDFLRGYTKAAAQFYSLLHSQAEADAMNEQFS